MNFFAHQDRSRRQTRWLLLMFALAVLAIVISVSLAMGLVLGMLSPVEGASLLSLSTLQSNSNALLFTSLGTGTVIGLASLGKTLSLRGGGGKVARQLGGTLVNADTRDPLQRRLMNVVEEIALASGVPMPQVYVLEQELGINAFAAGYSPADAAVAVTRGTLETLNRAELQGVIAHEFSHILNGDMRLNIRLMGALFGILLLGIIGRRILMHSHLMGRSRDNSGLVAIAVALVLLGVGYVGLFFGRMIKSAVSRQREYLADASAVQFTRDPGGIAGALKKIAVVQDHSFLNRDTEEVGHMLFGPGGEQSLFATHPPLMQRIARIEPNFQQDDLKVLAARMSRQQEREREKAAREQARAAQPERKRAPFDPQTIIDQIGNPDMERILMAASVAASLPAAAADAVHSSESALQGLLLTLLHQDPTIAERQLAVLEKTLGSHVADQVRALQAETGSLPTGQRLPLLEIALPALHRQPPEVLHSLLQAADQLIRIDGQVDVFEYLLARILRQYLWEASNPQRVRTTGRASVRRRRDDIHAVLAVVAWHGNPAEPAQALAAYAAGCAEVLGEQPTALPSMDDWMGTLDHALDRLDVLTADGKEQLVRALAITVSYDGRLVEAELELMRVVCTALHVPIPALQTFAAD